MLPYTQSILVYFIVSLFLCFEMAVQVSPSVMTSQLMQDFQIGAFGLGVISSVYYYTYTLMQIPAGLLFDRFNIRFVVILPLLVCSLGTYLFGHSHSLLTAALARLLMGSGSAFAFIAVLVVSSEIFDKKYFALLSGITQMLAAFGAMGGQTSLGWLVQSQGWRTTMTIIATTGFIIAFFIYFFVRYERQTSPQKQAKNESIIANLKIIFSEKQTWFIAGYACLLWAPMAAFASLWGVPFLAEAYALSNGQATFLTSMMWLGIAIGSPVLGWWSDYLRSRTIPLFLCALLGVVSLSILLLPTSLPLILIFILLFLLGMACSGQALTFASVKDNHSRGYLASALSFNNMAIVIAGAIFQPLIGKIIQIHSAQTLQTVVPILTASDYRVGLSVLILGLFIGMILSGFYIQETLKKSIKDFLPF
jgi:MFS family permease